MINQRRSILKTLIQLYILSRFSLVKDDDGDQRDDKDGDSDSYDDYGEVNSPLHPIWGEPTGDDSDSTADDKAGLANKDAEWEAERGVDDDDDCGFIFEDDDEESDFDSTTDVNDDNYKQE